MYFRFRIDASLVAGLHREWLAEHEGWYARHPFGVAGRDLPAPVRAGYLPCAFCDLGDSHPTGASWSFRWISSSANRWTCTRWQNEYLADLSFSGRRHAVLQRFPAPWLKRGFAAHLLAEGAHARAYATRWPDWLPWSTLQTHEQDLRLWQVERHLVEDLLLDGVLQPVGVDRLEDQGLYVDATYERGLILTAEGTLA